MKKYQFVLCDLKSTKFDTYEDMCKVFEFLLRVFPNQVVPVEFYYKEIKDET